MSLFSFHLEIEVETRNGLLFMQTRPWGTNHELQIKSFSPLRDSK